MALFKNSSLLASSKQFGSIVDKSVRCVCSGEQILLLVSVGRFTVGSELVIDFKNNDGKQARKTS